MSTIGTYSFDKKALDRVMEGMKGKRILVQLPDGVKRYASEVLYILEPYGADVHLWGGTCFGACDFPPVSGYDMLIQFGHAPIPGVGDDKTVFIPLRHRLLDDSELVGVIEAEFPDAKPSITLLTTIQHSHDLPRIAERLREYGYTVEIPPPPPRSAEPGQVLGCNAGNLKINTDIAIFIGSGVFHPLGVALSNMETRVLAYHPGKARLRDMAERAEKMVRKRWAMMERAKKASRFGVIASTRPGQSRVKEAQRAVEMLRAHGKEAEVVMTEIVDMASLLDWDFDAYVITVCPRLALDDSNRFHVPVITLVELEMMLENSQPDQYRFDTLG